MQNTTQSTYADLGRSLHFSPELSKAIEALGFQSPTPIQAQAIPIAIQGRDLIGNAQTGTGKTAAFCIPIFEQLLKDDTSTGLVLAPTRELVQQIETLWRALTRFMPKLKHACLIGGVSMQPQLRALSQKPRLIVATPGRLLDHARRRSVDLRKTRFLVLDEADRMLDMGFAPQLNEIMKLIPQKRQTLLFSATWAPEVDKLASRYLHQPERVAVGEVSKPTTQVTQEIIHSEVRKKNDAVLDQINARQGSILIFARTQHRTDRLAQYLDSYGLEVGRIHGGRTQAQRSSALEFFRRGKIRILVATDIAARGIDVPEIGHVINYDLPQQPEDYVHRIGRAGRAGARGMALSILTPEDRSTWRDIERILKKTGGTLPTILKQSDVKNTDEPKKKEESKHATPKHEAKEVRREHGARREERRERPEHRERRQQPHERRQRHERSDHHERREPRYARDDRRGRSERPEYRERREERRERPVYRENREYREHREPRENRERRVHHERQDRPKTFGERRSSPEDSRFGRQAKPRFKDSANPRRGHDNRGHRASR